ncbi:RHS repeat-associated core domain-containing protein [Pseudomonas sp. 10-1B]|uniref:RHS repeat-associated core domain-containing protein n=1 Tax=Pseudomonas sp. 10-1B TaxID=1546029 RepID=UPI000A9DDCD5
MNKAQSEIHPERRNYSAYGHDPVLQSSKAVLGFNGEQLHRATTSYHLGNGYRSYSPLLMRFCSPDSWSPFGRGGLNAYCYCEGDPVNSADPSGRALVFLRNGQIMRVNQNMARPAGQWLGPPTLTRTTSLPSLNYHSAPNQSRQAAFTGTSPISEQPSARSTLTKTVALQRVPPLHTNTPPPPAEWVTVDARHGPLLVASTTSANPPATMNQQVRQDVSLSSSTTTSSDSTPSHSRSASPTPLALPYHVQVATRLRENPNYSQRFDP